VPGSPLTIVQDGDLERLEEATSRYEAAISDQMKKYLVGPERGLKPATAIGDRLGEVVDPLPEHEAFEGYLAIPYLGLKGEVLKIRFRKPPWIEGRAKYMDVPHATPRVYNVSAIEEADSEICVAEGEFDTLMLKQLGLPAIGLPGASSWKPHHRRMLAGFSRVWVFGDPDEAGYKMISTITASMRQARGIYLTVGDVTDTVLSGNEGEIWSAING